MAAESKLLVLHWAGTTGQGCVNTFLSIHAKGSANYVVFETGRIVQMVKEEFIAWHAGKSRLEGYPTKDFQGWSGFSQPCSIGIELAGRRLFADGRAGLKMRL